MKPVSARQHSVAFALLFASVLGAPSLHGQQSAAEVMRDVSYGQRTDVFSLKFGRPGGSDETAATMVAGNGAAASTDSGYIQVQFKSVPVSALDAPERATYDYFSTASDILVRVPRGWSFRAASIRYWTDFPASDLLVWHHVPTTTTGSWSKAETEGWNVEGSVGFFGLVPTGGASLGASFSTTKDVSLPGLVVRDKTGSMGNNSAGWDFYVAGDDPNLPIASRNGPTLTFYDQFVLRARSAAVRPRFVETYGASQLPPSMRLRPPYPVTKDGYPALTVHFQISLRLDGNGAGRWTSPVTNLIIPFADLPLPAAPPKTGLAVYLDGGPFYEDLRDGKIAVVVQPRESDPARWTAANDIRDQHWSLGSADDLVPASDWVTAGPVREIGESAVVQATMQRPGLTVGGVKQFDVRSIRLRRDPLARTDDGANFRLIPSSVLLDLLTNDGDPRTLAKRTVSWLQVTGWSYTAWSPTAGWHQVLTDR